MQAGRSVDWRGSYHLTSPSSCLPEAAAAADPVESQLGRILASSVDGASGPKEGRRQWAVGSEQRHVWLERGGQGRAPRVWVLDVHGIAKVCWYLAHLLPVPPMRNFKLELEARD